MKRIGTIALFCLAVFLQAGYAQRFTQVWRVDAGAARFPTTGDTYRGAAYNPVTDKYLVATRTPATSILVLNALTGAIVDSLNVSIITGGTLPIVDIEVTSAGVIYATNLVLNSGADTTFKIYRWENQTAVPTLAFSGRAGVARVGDSFDVAGSGTGTVMYAGGNSATSVIQVFTTTDGLNFTVGTPINILPQEAGAGIAQVTPGGNAWVSRFASLNKIDLVNTTGTKIDSIDGSVSGISTGDLAYFTVGARKFLAVAPASAAGGTFGNTEPARLLEVSAGGGAAVFIDSTTRLSANANANASGDVDVKISGSTITLFVLVGNNGVAAFTITPPPPAVLISGVVRSTRVPNSGDSVVVTARIVDVSGTGIVSDSLLYARNGLAQPKLAMPRISGTNVDGVYRAVIPAGANSNGSRIEYQVFARSTSGTINTTAVSPANSYFAGISPLSLTGVRALSATRSLLYADYYARVTGTINGPNFQTTNLGYNLQDAVGGINLFKSGTVTPTLALGDSVTVLGKLAQFRGLTEITPDTVGVDIQIVASGRPVVPIAVTVADFNANPEQYEGRVVRMTTLQRRDVTTPWPLAGASANIAMYQGAVPDTIIMRIDSDTEIDGSPEPTYPVTVAGVITQFTSTTTNYDDGYQTQPRYLTDFTQVHDIGAAGVGRTSSANDSPVSSRDVLRNGNVAPGIEVLSSSTNPAAYSNNAPPVFNMIVRNFGDIVESAYQIGWQIDGVAQTPVSNTRPLAIAGRDTIALTWAVPVIGNHTMRAWTILATDANRTNDTSGTLYFTVVPDNVVFQEGFNNTTFPPVGWTIVDRDTDAVANNWYLATSSPSPFEGPSYAGDNYQSANANNYIDDYLITPNIPGSTVVGEFDSLVFWGKSRFTSPGYPDSLDIRVSTTGRDTSNFTTRLRYFRVDTGWTRYAFALPAGTTRYIAFRYLIYDGGSNGNNSDKVCVDDVRVIRYQPAPPLGWTAQTSGITNAFYSVKAVSPTVAWGAAKGGNVVRTVNGGATWTSVGGGRIGTNDIYNITAVDANIAFVTTSPSATYIFRTTTGGAVWDTVFTQVGGFIDAMHMYDAINGIALGDPVGGKFTILKTSNGGTTWARIATEPTPGSAAEASSQNDLCVSGTNNIWFGASANGRIYRSTDAGATWAFSLVPGATAATNAISVWFNSPTLGIAGHTTTAGVYNAARSTDGGATWSAMTVGTAGYNIAVAGSGAVDFWMARGTGMYRSTDKGVSWNLSYTGVGTNYDVDFVTSGASTSGWAVTDSGRIANFNGTITGVKENQQQAVPTEFALQQNYPNPFNPSTTIRYALPEAASVTLSVYNLLGQRVAQLASDVQSAGYYTNVWNGRNDAGMQVASGVYFYRIDATPVSGGAPFNALKKMLLLK